MIPFFLGKTVRYGGFDSKVYVPYKEGREKKKSNHKNNNVNLRTSKWQTFPLKSEQKSVLFNIPKRKYNSRNKFE